MKMLLRIAMTKLKNRFRLENSTKCYTIFTVLEEDGS